MNNSIPIINDLDLGTKTNQAARAVGELLRHTPEYEAFLKTLKAVNDNPDVQRISNQIRIHQNALRWFQGDLTEHEASLTSLETELEALPVIQDYRRAESSVSRMFAEVDSIISQAAGVPFAANAGRSGCGCGG
jgi:cell fate (sporulation/competence/biofilm development) regulator YmcA (YheA/YmcA/DUF963 family)